MNNFFPLINIMACLTKTLNTEQMHAKLIFLKVQSFVITKILRLYFYELQTFVDEYYNKSNN